MPKPPILLAQLAAKPELRVAMDWLLDMTVRCTEGSIDLITEDDLFGYIASEPYQLYAVASNGSGGAWHLWSNMADNLDECPVVFLGSEGERAKVGQKLSEFLHISLSLQPHFMDAINQLPGLNALPDNGNIDAATESDFDIRRVLGLLEGWMAQDQDRTAQACAAANSILVALQLERLPARDALARLVTAHLARPRFAIQASD